MWWLNTLKVAVPASIGATGASSFAIAVADASPGVSRLTSRCAAVCVPGAWFCMFNWWNVLHATAVNPKKVLMQLDAKMCILDMKEI